MPAGTTVDEASLAQALAAAGTAPKDCETAGPWCVKGANWVAFDADL